MKIVDINKIFDVEVSLPGSKSESNRALMICYYRGDFKGCKDGFEGLKSRIRNLSEADDTRLLAEILTSLSNGFYSSGQAAIDCHNAGTVLRFLVTALALREGDYVLTGSDRMLQRPVGDLVDAMRMMGADIEYLGREGFAPLKIHGRPNLLSSWLEKDSVVAVDITRSSQFASSILLALPAMMAGKASRNVDSARGRATLRLMGELSSLPYIDMTLEVMRRYGAKVSRDGRDVVVEPSEYQNVDYVVEGDWSAASYWYEMVALSERGRATLKNLHLDSAQGDAVVAKLFESLGVESMQCGNDVVISKRPDMAVNELKSVFLRYNFTDTPDLFPTIAATCAGLGIQTDFTGLRNLAIKESDRVAAMTAELSKIVPSSKTSQIVFDSHNDHRIAMALAPLAMKIGALEIQNAEVVSKSYPDFWKEFQKFIPSR